MTELSDEEWDKQADTMADKLVEILADQDGNMVMEVLACIVSDMLEPYEPEEGIPLVLEFIGNILEKRYDLGFDITTNRDELMQ